MKLTSRQRVLRALDHQEVDRVPIDLGGTPNSTMRAGACAALAQALGIDAPAVQLSRVFDTVKMDEAVLRRLPVDTRAVFARPPARSTARWLDERSFVDEWGITYRRAEGGREHDPVGYPLAEAGLADLERYTAPDVADPSRYAGLGEQARALHEGTDYAICACTADTVIFDKAWQLRGMEQFLADMLLQPDFALALLEKVFAAQALRQECFLREVGRYIDVIVIADDMGAQHGPLIRPELYRRMVKPFHRRYVELIRRHTGARIHMHACGSIAALAPDYADIGIDALNPVQVSAAGMSPASLKSISAGRMAFWGGIDTQWLLPQGTPQQVRESVRETLRVMDAQNGGYVLAAVHNIQDDVPPANVLAMLDEAGR